MYRSRCMCMCHDHNTQTRQLMSFITHKKGKNNNIINRRQLYIKHTQGCFNVKSLNENNIHGWVCFNMIYYPMISCFYKPCVLLSHYPHHESNSIVIFSMGIWNVIWWSININVSMNKLLVKVKSTDIT